MSIDPIQFHKDGKRVYLSTNKGDRDLAELVLLDPKTGATEFVERDPEGKVDFSNAIFSRATASIWSFVMDTGPRTSPAITIRLGVVSVSHATRDSGSPPR